jgi:hypothetical protein
MSNKLYESDVEVKTSNGLSKELNGKTRVSFENVMIFIDYDDIKMRKMFGDFLLDRFSQFLSKTLIDDWNTHLEEWEGMMK